MVNLGIPVTRDQLRDVHRAQRHRFSFSRPPNLDELCERQRVCREVRNTTLTAHQPGSLLRVKGAPAWEFNPLWLDASSWV